MKKWMILTLTICVIFALGFRDRYGPAFWRAVTGGISYDNNVAISGAFNYGADAEASDTYVVTITGITAYTTGMFITLDPNNDNTGACTINVNGLGAKSLKTVLGADPADNHIDDAQIVPLVYDGTNFIILTPDSNPA